MSIVAMAACDSKANDGRRGLRSEAELNLMAINKAADSMFAENSVYPIGTVGPTPGQSCCSFPGKKCPVVASDWNGVPAWDALGFEMTHAFYYQYAYTSDGKTYRATAVGDLDCDGTTVTYTLDGEAASGSPTSTLTKPARAD